MLCFNLITILFISSTYAWSNTFTNDLIVHTNEGPVKGVFDATTVGGAL